MPDVNKKSPRDKDNAAPRIKPPKNVRIAPKGFAPPGMSGIKPSPAIDKSRMPAGQAPKSPQAKKRFALGLAGELKKQFKPLVSKSPDKDKGIER